MKKDNKLIVLKSLIIAVFLILGNTALAQHPLLGPDELDVYVLPNQQQITIGKQAYDEGRTCYKWNGYFSENGTEERIGSLQVFDRPSYMRPNSNFEFVLTVIGEQYYQQTVWVHVIGNITFQVQPKKGCFSGNEVPQIQDFEITTNPRGLERYVYLVDYYTSFVSPLLWHYDVKFQLIIDNLIYDEKIATIAYADDSFVPVSVPIDIWVDAFKEIEDIPKNILKKLILLSPNGGYIDPSIPWHIGNYTVSVGFDCCDHLTKQTKIDVDRISIGAGIEAADLHVSIFPLVLGINGSFVMEFGIENFHSVLYKTCVAQPTEAYLFHSTNASLEAYVRDVVFGLLLYADAGFRYAFKDSTLKLACRHPGFMEASGCFNASLVLYADYTLFSFVKGHWEKELLPECGNCINKVINLNL